MNAQPLKAYIDVAALEHNCRVLRSMIPPGCRLSVAAKANGYGHGIGLALPAFEAAGVSMLLTATIQEACELRLLGWARPILVLGSELSLYGPSERREIAEWLVRHDVRVTLTREEDIPALAAAARLAQQPARVHLKFDTGMSRMGVAEAAGLGLVARLAGDPLVQLEGVYTHFATADEYDKTFANEQLERFRRLLAELRTRRIAVPLIHAANSAALIDLPESHFDLVRPGIAVYGYQPSSEMHHQPDLRPAMKLVSRLTLVKRLPAGSAVGYGGTFRTERDTLTGIVPIGYADGYDRRFSNRAKMLIAGRAVPVIGRVSMDQTIVDLTDFERTGGEPQPGTEVVVIDNRRASPNSVEALAALLQTVPNEIVTRIGPRVQRIATGPDLA